MSGTCPAALANGHLPPLDDLRPSLESTLLVSKTLGRSTAATQVPLIRAKAGCIHLSKGVFTRAGRQHSPRFISVPIGSDAP